MKVPYIQLGAQHEALMSEILEKIRQILSSGQFILGEELAQFERKFADYCGTKYALGVANGTDALYLTMLALGIGKGDEVITAPNSFLASASSIAIAGAKPVFADVRKDFNLDPVAVEKAITEKTRAVIAVHLTGRPAPMNELQRICRQKNLFLIEDSAQAVGAKYHNQSVGSMGNAGCFSLHPLKNLAACGDGGVITTNDEALFDKLKMARNHGLKNRDECAFWSYNSRLDNLQAAILNVKLQKLDDWTERRRHFAGIYQTMLADCPIVLPIDESWEHSVYHTFIIQTEKRDELKGFLEAEGIDTKIHYPIPIHLQPAAALLGYKKGNFPVCEKQAETILSLPVFPELTTEQIEYTANKIIEFYK